jgi:raffinose/stachyose/melibiose transport system permease protein
MTARRAQRISWPTQIVTILAAILFAFPFYLLVNVSLRSADEGFANPYIPTTHPTVANFSQAWTQANLGSALLDSGIVTVATTTLVLLLGSLAGYGIARATSRIAKATFATFVLGLTIPFQVSMIPLYTTLRDLHLLGTLQGLIIFETGANLPLAVFLFTTFLRNNGLEYEEAASIDGCGSFRTYWSIVLPISRAAAGTAGIITAIRCWNDFLAPLLFLSGSRNATVPLALYQFVGDQFSQWNIVFAGLLIAMLPVLILYFFLQGTIIKGFAGGLKG